MSPDGHTPSPTARRLGPLQRVVAEWTDDDGVPWERLACGHEIHRKQDVFGHTNAYRRRCRHCRDGRNTPGPSSVGR